MGKGERGFDCGAEGVFVNAIGGGAGGTAFSDGANGNCESVFGDVLVNGVVGETGQSAGDFVNVDFGSFGAGGFGETKNRFNDATKFALGEKVSGSCAGVL